ncbi:MAG: hypothetical protein HWQ38_18955 [Nostoc sp. NMS7]|uniref:hypothetical protein n=1 Tax=Nostoc sp. NMS7 TaxID=2815391 RepID=UPI0025D03724|nr:hypothetical protein [Nostoc sp. NMS7]MBN3948416.1 hypothetical protein [Nostoc sp. NMS7]
MLAIRLKNHPVEQIEMVSASLTKREAGELMEEWIKENDPQNLDYETGGVKTIRGTEYIKLQDL